MPERKPAITAPVTRLLFVADPARSVAFYCGMLGFEERDVQRDSAFPTDAAVVYGPARIQFGRRSGGETTERCVLFFEVEDVSEMHAALTARGAGPSGIEKVNWIKMEVFEVRDPDGHALWFGKSFAQPHASVSRPMLSQILPELPLDDVAAGVTHYRDVLGFRINYQQHDLGVMDRDNVRLLLITRTGRHTGVGSAYVYVEDADALYAELRARGANLQGEPVSHPWGLRDFAVLDPEGNRITFGQPFE